MFLRTEFHRDCTPAGHEPRSGQPQGVLRFSLRALIAVAIVSSLLPNRLPAAEPVSEATLAKRRQEIASLSDSQRKELIRKYDTYRQLEPAERQQLHRLHENLEAHEDLKVVMQRYCEWLKNLDAPQRQQLRDAKTPEQKRELVVRFHQEQHRRKEEMWRGSGPGAPPPPPPARGVPLLSSDELREVMTSLEAELVKQGAISSTALADLVKAEGTQRYKLLMRSIAEIRHPKSGDVRDFEFPEPVRKIVAKLLRNGDMKGKLLEPWRDLAHRQYIQRFVFQILLASTAEEARLEFTGGQSEKLKQALFNSLPADEQARFSHLPPKEHDFYLMDLHRNEIWRAFSSAGDLPERPLGERNQREGGPRSRIGDFLFRPGDGNRPPRAPPERDRDRPNDGRRPDPRD